MTHCIERVYKSPRLRGKAMAISIMAYLIYRSNDDGVCWPGKQTMMNELGMTKATLNKWLAWLEENHHIRTTVKHGRGLLTVIELNCHYTKGVKFIPFLDDKRVQNQPLSHSEKGIESTPLPKEKGINLTEKGSNFSKRGQFFLVEGKEVEEKEEEEEKNPPKPPRSPETVPRQPTPGRRVGRLTDPALDLPRGLEQLKTDWLRFQRHRMERNRPVQPTEAEELFKSFLSWGVDESRAAISYTIRKGWQGVERDPHFGRASPNGHRPKTFAEIQEENNRRAILEAQEFLRAGK